MKLRGTLLAIVDIVTASPLATSGSPTVTIKDGIVIGTTTTIPSATASVNKYLGIPYQKSPPVRFAPPSPVTPWQQPLDASSFGDQCIQQYIGGALSAFATAVSSNVTESEDCLYLNVWQPTGTPPQGGWPVMFWMYGGGFQFGSADLAYYDGSNFAAFENVIIVSFNYRVNVFGYPSGAGLPLNETNLGFLDQRYALQWVQDNIATFSGDPDKVTIFGESAGAISADALLTVPPASPLPFRAAILESGTVITETLALSTGNNDAAWKSLVAGVNCSNSMDTLSCVRAVPATAIKDFIQTNGTSFLPVVDNVTFITNATGSRTSGRAANVPLLIGANANEGTLFTYGQTNVTAFVNGLFAAIPFVIPQVLERYAIGTPRVSNDFDAISQIYGDIAFQCPTSVVVNQSTAAGNPTWRYYFNSTFPNTEPLPALKVYHSSEIPLVFGTYPTANATAQEYSLSQYMRGAWASFARNPTAGPGWDQHGTHNGIDLGVLGGVESAGVTVESAQGVDSRCDLFTGLYTFLTT